MPIIVAEKAGTCTAAGCGGRILRGELCWFEATTGTRHLERACREASAGRRPNRRAGRCRCGAHVPPGEGGLTLRETRRAGRHRKQWTVICARCS
ncbi:hypothetical protein FJV41_39150 [Myxococcus llanfairpwllgwyngyllgogerychwyrndrobwllllantysiliogogogochensis]|uniref:Uncharacterized protein n=1 Tax=Myxococcus llanfairpwllgwyngyllgogerychwyrndrobwllllantysiliogogogochensis TaxID=2590453 RepID=A0A540WN83_9BACT|nr:hypothetical protein FJV41_39150 [Myxococcus llanfairpwllgwyngyllgogerychwyrndrobwllllantysiliogogogochensis]